MPVSPAAKALAQNFTGDVYVNQVKSPREPSRPDGKEGNAAGHSHG